MKMLTVSQVARRLPQNTGRTISPQIISNLFCKRLLDDDRCPVVGRCRAIPEDYLLDIEQALHARGLRNSEPCEARAD